MSSIFCCPNPQAYKNRTLSHEPKFRTFMTWANYPKESSIAPADTAPDVNTVTLAIQVVKQVNYGPLESKRYFAQTADGFVEVNEQWLVGANFEKLNTYVIRDPEVLCRGKKADGGCRFKNYKCGTHNRFFEVNVYQKDPVNAHHWRANIARPATEIDL